MMKLTGTDSPDIKTIEGIELRSEFIKLSSMIENELNLKGIDTCSIQFNDMIRNKYAFPSWEGDIQRLICMFHLLYPEPLDPNWIEKYLKASH